MRIQDILSELHARDQQAVNAEGGARGGALPSESQEAQKGDDVFESTSKSGIKDEYVTYRINKYQKAGEENSVKENMESAMKEPIGQADADSVRTSKEKDGDKRMIEYGSDNDEVKKSEIDKQKDEEEKRHEENLISASRYLAKNQQGGPPPLVSFLA